MRGVRGVSIAGFGDFGQSACEISARPTGDDWPEFPPVTLVIRTGAACVQTYLSVDEVAELVDLLTTVAAEVPTAEVAS